MPSEQRPNLTFLDFESYFDNEYSLKKMTPIEYILDPRFEALGCGVVYEDGDKEWVDGPDLPYFFDELDWDQLFAISHNALFDALILAVRYNKYPKKYGCTMSMAKNWISHQVASVSLASCARRYGLPDKMDTTRKFKGLNFAAIKQLPELYRELTEYGIDDAEKSFFLYHQMLAEGFPPRELDVIDWVVRMAAQPQLEIDRMVVAEHLGAVLAKKQELLDNAGLENRDLLMRDDALAAALAFLGVEPVPRKTSKNTGKEQWAFAKTDKPFTDLLEHENPDVQALVAARLGHKSTIEQTRAERFLSISTITTSFPVPLKYSGAHTHRFSGDWSLNLQNLPHESKLRHALKAPKGCVVVAVDASQIEARFNATLSGERWLVDSFRKGRDVYSDFASVIYNRPVVKQLDKVERFVGKTAILSLGYGSSPPVFQAMCRNKGNVHLTDNEAFMAVQIYRTRCPKIVEHWQEADKQIIPMLAHGINYQWGAMQLSRERLTLPNGNSLKYHQLRYEFSEQLNRMQWTYMRGVRPQGLYGAKLVENECQSLAFVHIVEVALRVADLTEGLLWPAHQNHDDLIYVVPEKLAEQAKTLIIQEMSKSPVWLPEAPLAAEGRIGESYGSAK
jgi:hypothetical protein